MAFTRGLFYPWIDIENDAWLKTAVLYWDTIQTIVPDGMSRPYQAPAAQALYEEQVLEPFIVEPRMQDIQALTQAVITYLDTPEGLDVLAGGPDVHYRYLHPQKLPREIRDIVRLHPSKIPDYVRERLSIQASPDEWIPVDRRFAGFYMTLLATRISEQHGLGLLTDTGAADSLATAAKLGAHHKPTLRPQWSQRRYAGHDENWITPPTLAEGVLATLILERLELDPSTPVKRILEFRKKHSDELGRFRAKVGELTASISTEAPINRLQQHVGDLYKNDVQPAINDLKRALKGTKIKYVAENFVKVSCFSLGGTSLPLTLMGMGASYAVLVGAGVSLTACAALYNVEKDRQLSGNPYTYLLAAERAFY